jgi:mycothiol synthase
VPPATIRRLAAGDATAFAALVDRARDAGDLAGSSAPHAEWLVQFSMDRPELIAVAQAGDALVGWVHPEAKALVVEPAWRRQGIGRLLVEAGLDIERERDRANLLVGVLQDDAPSTAFLEATGFAFHSTLWDLELPPTTDLAPPAWPDGIETRTIRPPDDIAPWVELFNAAFADHATPLQLDATVITAHWTESPARDEDLLLAADASGRLLGFSATEPQRLPDGGVGPRGEIWTIGVHPDAQGRGLGRALLRWGAGHLRSLGTETVFLSVNGRNPRALGLYESEGFVRTSTRDRWARPVDA